MKHIIILGLTCLSMSNLFAYSYGMTDYERQSLRNQEMMIQQQQQENRATARRDMMNGTTRMGYRL